jgi:hypothetical protein
MIHNNPIAKTINKKFCLSDNKDAPVLQQRTIFYQTLQNCDILNDFLSLFGNHKLTSFYYY